MPECGPTVHRFYAAGAAAFPACEEGNRLRLLTLPIVPSLPLRHTNKINNLTGTFSGTKGVFSGGS